MPGKCVKIRASSKGKVVNMPGAIDSLLLAMPFDSPVFTAAVVVIVSVAYAAWLWSRLRVGRYDALCCSIGIICFQLIAAFTNQNPPLALVAP